MTVRHFLAAVVAGAGLALAGGGAGAQPVASPCFADFALSDRHGSHASADIRNGSLDRLYVEMGPARVAMTTKGPGVSGAYTSETPDLMIWNYMSIYQPAAEWLARGSVRLDYSGFRVAWPEFRLAGQPVAALKLTVSQGDLFMTFDIDGDADRSHANTRVFAIDFEAMLAGRHPVMRVDDHAAWRRAAEAGRAISVTLTDASNGKVVARAEAPRLESDMLQSLLSGGLNALRDKFRAGGCS